ncbi:hypothetical protein EV401DRAFT_2200715 [Pisolithus croceorrhizus]|nr:hypothetical protein EV401DRAFT_2200715 [Pisolithus croceorrhizus]
MLSKDMQTCVLEWRSSNKGAWVMYKCRSATAHVSHVSPGHINLPSGRYLLLFYIQTLADIRARQVHSRAIPNVGPKNKGRAHEHTHEHANCTPKLCLYLGPGVLPVSGKGVSKNARDTILSATFARSILDIQGDQLPAILRKVSDSTLPFVKSLVMQGHKTNLVLSPVSPGGGCLPVEWMWAERATTQFYPSYQGETPWTPKGISPPQFRQSWLKAQIRRLDTSTCVGNSCDLRRAFRVLLIKRIACSTSVPVLTDIGARGPMG